MSDPVKTSPLERAASTSAVVLMQRRRASSHSVKPGDAGLRPTGRERSGSSSPTRSGLKKKNRNSRTLMPLNDMPLVQSFSMKRDGQDEWLEGAVARWWPKSWKLEVCSEMGEDSQMSSSSQDADLTNSDGDGRTERQFVPPLFSCLLRPQRFSLTQHSAMAGKKNVLEIRLLTARQTLSAAGESKFAKASSDQGDAGLPPPIYLSPFDAGRDAADVLKTWHNALEEARSTEQTPSTFTRSAPPCGIAQCVAEVSSVEQDGKKTRWTPAFSSVLEPQVVCLGVTGDSVETQRFELGKVIKVSFDEVLGELRLVGRGEVHRLRAIPTTRTPTPDGCILFQHWVFHVQQWHEYMLSIIAADSSVRHTLRRTLSLSSGNLLGPASPRTSRIRRSLSQLGEESPSPAHKTLFEKSAVTSPSAPPQKKISEWVEKLGRPLTRRERTIDEILQTEESFAKHLDIMINGYRNPLQFAEKRAELILTKGEISVIFSPVIDVIARVSAEFLSSLYARLSSWTAGETRVGDIFNSTIPFFRCFRDYCVSYPRAESTLRILRGDETRPAIEKFLQMRQSGAESVGLDLRDLLITPVQRLPRYVLLLSELISHTEETHPDYAELDKALHAMREVCDEQNARMRESEDMALLTDIASTRDDADALLQQGRRLIHKAAGVELFVKGRSTLGWLFLFNDAIIFCPEKKGTPLAKTTVLLNECELSASEGSGGSKPHRIVSDPPRTLFIAYKKGKQELQFVFDMAAACSTFGTLLVKQRAVSVKRIR